MNRPPLSAAEQAELERARELVEQAERLYTESKYVTANTLLEDALMIQERILGQYHLDHITLLDKLAKTKRKEGQYSAVLPLYRRIADTYLQVLGAEHLKTILAFSQLALRHIEEYSWEAAKPLLEYVTELKKEAFGNSDPNVILSRSYLNDPITPLTEEKEQEGPRLSRSEKWERALTMLTPQQEALLAGIEQIDWFNLDEDYSASEIPNYLRLLLADDEDIREEARYELERILWNYETHEIDLATPFVVPFLLNLLKDDEPLGKNEILYLLSTLVGGHSILADMATSPQSRKKMEELFKEKRQDFYVCLQKDQACIEATKRAVGDGIPIYFEFLVNEEDLEFKEECFYILSRLSNEAAQIVPRLQRMLLNEENAKIRAYIVRTLYDLMDDGAEAQQFFVNLIRHSDDEGITFIAAGALTKRAREKTPESAVEILLNASRKLGPLPLYDPELTPAHDEIRERYSPIWLPEELCFVQGYYSTTGLPMGLDFAVYVLKYLGKKRGITTFKKLLPTMQNPINALRATEMMLDLAFNNEPKMPIFCSAHYPDIDRHYESADAHPQRDSSSLTNAQRAVLVALVTHDPLWEVSHNLLELYGLPISRDELQFFLTH